MTESLTHIWKSGADRLTPAGGDPAGDNVREFWLAVRRQFWLVLLFAFAGLTAGAFHFATSPAQYYASATLLIEEKQSDLDQEISSLRPLARNDTGFQNQLQILQSQKLAIEVVRALELHENSDFISPPRSTLGQTKSEVIGALKAVLPRPAPAMRDSESGGPQTAEDPAVREAAALLVQRTEFLRLGKSYSVEVGFRSHDPNLAAAIADAYARAYLEDGTRANLEASDRTAVWMQERIAEVQEAASAASLEAETFRSANRATDQQGLREREQQVETLNELLLALEARYQEQLLAGSFPVENGRILSAALVPDEPVKPVAWQLLLAGLAAGGLVGLGLAVGRELRETGFRNAEDVRAVGLNFLGYLPALKNSDRKTARASKVRLTPPVEARDETKVSPQSGGSAGRRLSLGVPNAPAIVEDHLPSAGGETPYGRATRGVLWSMDMAGTNGRARVLGVSGLVRNEGATTLAANLADQAAGNGGRVLLIDADLAGAGLSRLVRSAGNVRVEPPSEFEPLWNVRRLGSGVHFLPAADGGASVSHRVRAIRAAIEAGSTIYDLVVVDMPPMTNPDTASLVQPLDGIVMVVRWGRTTRHSIDSFLKRSPGFRRKVSGAVLNRARLGKLRRYGVSAEEYNELCRKAKGRQMTLAR